MKLPKPHSQAVHWEKGVCVLLDQTRVPKQETYLRCEDYLEVVDAIKKLAVRGAPAIGVAGAYAVVLAARQATQLETNASRKEYLTSALESIRTARPTAVNLEWAVKRMRAKIGDLGEPEVTVLEAEATEIHKEDIGFNQKIAEHGVSLLSKKTSVITYCNTGDLATGGIGTAFGVIHAGYLNDRVDHVYPCETRPVMQGLRLTAWELAQNKIPFTVICDNMAASLMRTGKIGAVFVGADRIAANGDAANKIGTYMVAVLAKHHGIPFYVVAPSSTFDMSLASGESIPIEQRNPEEIFSVLGDNRPSEQWQAYNPAFDVTPNHLISAIVCEKAAIKDPTTEKIAQVLR